MLSWLTVLGLEEHADTISGYVSESTALKDLLGMLTAEQEDEDEEDLKDLIKDMEIDGDGRDIPRSDWEAEGVA